MTVSRRRIPFSAATAVFILCIAPNAAGFPNGWSLTLSQGLSYAALDEKFSSSTSLSGSVSDVPVGGFTGAAAASASLSTTITPEFELSPSVTLDSATLTRGRWTLGRQSVRDAGGLIVQHTLDGVTYAAGERRPLSFGLYSPLLLGAGNSSILLSNLDLQLSSRETLTPGPPRIIAGASYGGRADTAFGAEVWFQADGRHLHAPAYESVIEPGDSVDDVPDGAGGTVDTGYQLIWMSARLGERTRLSLYAAAMEGIGVMAPLVGEGADRYKRDILLSGAGRVSLAFTLNRWAFEMTADGAGGDIDALSFTEGNTLGYSTLYQPISVITRGQIVGLELGNSASGALIVSAAPFRAERYFTLRYLRFIWETRGFFRTTTGPTSFGDISEESLSPYLGTETSLMVQWQFLPDLTLMVTSALFVPGTYPAGAVSADYAGGSTAVYQGGVTLTLAY